MVKLALHSIAYEAKTLNLAKEGSTTFYVDGTDGLDIHDGGSWAQAFKTIQKAVDEAGSWTKIFVKAGAYTENVDITDKYGLHINGENRETTIINGGAMAALYGNTIMSVFSSVTLKTTSATFLTQLTGKYNRIQSCIVDSSGIGIVLGGDHSVIDEVRVDAIGSPYPAISIGGMYGQISNCIVDCSCDNGIVLSANTHYTKVFGNTIVGVTGGGSGIQANQATTTQNTIFHNNLISNANQILDNGSNNSWFENYYDNHTTDVNNTGLADTAYTENGATDYQPVSRRNGWHQRSIRNNTMALASVCTNTRLAELDAANLPADVSTIIENQRKSWNWDCLSGTYKVLNGTWVLSDNSSQYIGKNLRNSSAALNDQIAIPFVAASVDPVTLNYRCMPNTHHGIITVYVEGVSQGTIDEYGTSGYNVIKTLSITPARAGLNVFRLKVTGKNASSSGYIMVFSELWFS